MALIDCPACGKRHSSVQPACPHCGAARDERSASRRRKPAGVGPNIHLLIAMLAAIGGAGWYYSAMASGGDTVYARWLIGAGLVWYVVARIWAAVDQRRRR